MPYPSWPGGQVKVRWVATFQTREYGNGLKEPVPGRGKTYRPFFDLSYDYLEEAVQWGLWELLRAETLTFAPYSITDEVDGLLAVPQAFNILPPPEIPDTADLLLSRYPFGLTLEGTEEFALADIPNVGGSGGVPVPPCGDVPAAPDAAPEGAFAAGVLTWTWNPVDDVTGYLIEWGTVDGGPYANVAIVYVADLGNPLAPEFSHAATAGVTYYARVRAFNSDEA